jgi:hypothetical protein
LSSNRGKCLKTIGDFETFAKRAPVLLAPWSQYSQNGAQGEKGSIGGDENMGKFADMSVDLDREEQAIGSSMNGSGMYTSDRSTL